MLPNDEVINFEDTLYVNPQKSLDEQNAFIDALRSTQNQNNAEINTQTYNLGTAVPSNLGGLTGGEGYFTARYQAPQSTSLAANLRATAQAQALNDILSNELAMQKQRYNNAYKAARKRAAARSRYSGGGGGATTPTTNTGGGEVNTKATDELYATGEISIDQNDINRGGSYVQSMDINKYGGHDIIWVTPDGRNVTIPQLSDGSYATGNIYDLPGAKNLLAPLRK